MMRQAAPQLRAGWGNHVRQRHEDIAHRADAVIIDQNIAAFGHHHRVEDDPTRPTPTQHVGDHLSHVATGDHANLDRIDLDIVEQVFNCSRITWGDTGYTEATPQVFWAITAVITFVP